MPAVPIRDKAVDAKRKPAETMEFAGVKPGDKVAELAPGAGYFTRIFAKAVGDSGKVYTYSAPSDRPGEPAGRRQCDARRRAPMPTSPCRSRWMWSGPRATITTSRTRCRT